LQTGNGPALFRRTLVIVQFALSIFLIVGMLVIGRQMNYLRTRHLGLDRENVIYMPLEGDLNQPKRLEAFQRELKRQPSIQSTTESGHLPINIQSTSTDLKWAGKDPNQLYSVAAMSVGSRFVQTMNIKLVNGRDFRAGSLADTSNYLINESAAKLMGMTDPVGKEIEFWMGKGHVIGLMKDFHLNSLHQAIAPLVLAYMPGNSSYVLAKTRPGQTQQAITDLEKLTKQFNPNYPFAYHFLDEEYEKLYRSEQQVHTLVNYFGLLAILISCLGLFALAAFTAEQRTKEIGVRKVLGASVTSIVGLLSTDFLKLVLIALVLATPLAWLALDKWLNTFAYHETLPWWIFALAGLLAVLIALATVSYQSIRAALLDPVKSLRSE
jgi:ABC-type antimicrobial peptide transport system permease subunit